MYKTQLSNWPIYLYSNGIKIAETLTTNDGSYNFSNLHYGNYNVWEGSQENWRQTHPIDNNSTTPDPSLEKGHYNFQIISGSYLNDLIFGNVELGTIIKSVSHFWWANSIQDVLVTIEEVSVEGILDNIPSLPIEIKTNDNGEANFDKLLPGIYKISIDTPFDWYQDPPGEEHIIELSGGNIIEIENYIYNSSNREPRTLGFWKHWKKRYNTDDLQALIDKIKTGSGDFEALSLLTIDAMLSPAGKKSVSDMAVKQYLVLWLNIASEKLGFTTEIDLNGIDNWNLIVEDNYGQNDGIISIHYLMKELTDAFNNGELTRKERLEIFKNICDEINNYNLFLSPPTGPIN